jgi:glycosyltransferase involved in cell wall biosynthesis
MSRLAVVIPSYNHAHYITLALDSCLQQTRKPDRIIVIDDGSKDNSLEVLAAYEKKGVEVSGRENRGAHNTINEAIAKAATDCDFISILNSDDHYHPERFARLLPQLEARPDKSMICSGIRVIDGEDKDISPTESRAKWFRAIWSWQQRSDVEICEWLGLANFPATTSNVIARSSWLQRFPFRPYRFIHDYYFLLQTGLRDQMLMHPEPLVNYRVHATNTINTNPAPLLREMLRMNLDLLHDLAPELPGNARLRENLGTYLRSSWDNVSALHQGTLQNLLAIAAGNMSEDEIETLAMTLDEAAWPEIREYTNKPLVNEWDESGPLSTTTGLAQKFTALKAELKERSASQAALKELTKLQEKLTVSKKAALGRLLGWKPSHSGSTPQEKLASFRASLQASTWGRSLL